MSEPEQDALAKAIVQELWAYPLRYYMADSEEPEDELDEGDEGFDDEGGGSHASVQTQLRQSLGLIWPQLQCTRPGWQSSRTVLCRICCQADSCSSERCIWLHT